jgi:ABC-type uncharacterized transport system substrate-binding protein
VRRRQFIALKGAKKPVEQPTYFKQVVNLRVAEMFGLTIPESVLVATDDTIE